MAKPGLVLTGLAALMVSALPVSSADTEDLERISHDPYIDPAAQHATEVEPVLAVHGDTIVAAFQVGRFAAAGSDNIGWATSKDAGKSWRHGFLSGTSTLVGGIWHSISLPVIAYDRKHGVFLIAMQQFDDNGNGQGILVARSADGLNWSAPVQAAATNGENTHSFACDDSPKSPYYGTCYDSWFDYSDGVNSLNPIVRSTDGGLTWSAPVLSPDVAAGLVESIAIQPDGHLVVLGRGGGPNGDQIYAIPSTDGGRTLQPTVNITAQQFDYPWLRADPNPSSAVDAHGTIYVVIPDCRFRANCSDPGCRFRPTTSFCAPNDLVLTTSRNGVDWTGPARIPIDPLTSSTDHFITGLGVLSGSDAAHDRLALTYYYETNANLPDGTSCDFTNCLVSAGFISSADGGRSWREAQKVAGPMPEGNLVFTNAGEMVADYISAVFVNDKPFGAFAIAGPINPSTGAYNEAIYATGLGDD
jgi:hypothetical protein